MTTKCMKSKEKEMPDQEKVIKGLQIERECVSRDCDRDCGKCDLVQDRDWLLWVYDNALALLKEQEPKKPIVKHFEFHYTSYDEYEDRTYCPKCKIQLIQQVNYCSKCGQAVKWCD